MRREPEIIPIILHGFPTRVMSCEEYKKDVAEKFMKLLDALPKEKRQEVYNAANPLKKLQELYGR